MSAAHPRHRLDDLLALIRDAVEVSDSVLCSFGL